MKSTQFNKKTRQQTINCLCYFTETRKITVNNDATTGRPHRFLHRDWLQPRATSQKNEHVYFWLQSHRSCITVAVADVNTKSRVAA